jgi:hypothetical protein
MIFFSCLTYMARRNSDKRRSRRSRNRSSRRSRNRSSRRLRNRRNGGSFRKKMSDLYTRVKTFRFFKKSPKKFSRVLSRDEREAERQQELRKNVTLKVPTLLDDAKANKHIRDYQKIEAAHRKAEEELHQEREKHLDEAAIVNNQSPREILKHPNIQFEIAMTRRELDRKAQAVNLPKRRVKKRKWFWQ